MVRALLALVAALILSGCLCLPNACDAPYSTVGGECCLDENRDGICDRDKPICEKPYINIGNQCCIDSDESGICDSDETTTTIPPTTTTSTTTTTTTSTSTTTTTTSTTTTTLQLECDSINDCQSSDNVTCDGDGREVFVHTTPIMCSGGKCIYRSAKETSAYPCYPWEVCINGQGCVDAKDRQTTTTTTIKYRYDFSGIVDRIDNNTVISTTSTTTPACVDSDGGIRYDLLSSEVSGILDYNGSYFLGSEYCTNSEKVLEYNCESGLLKSRIYECPNNCIDGRCCLAEGRSCTVSKDCCSGSCSIIGLTRHCMPS